MAAALLLSWRAALVWAVGLLMCSAALMHARASSSSLPAPPAISHRSLHPRVTIGLPLRQTARSAPLNAPPQPFVLSPSPPSRPSHTPPPKAGDLATGHTNGTGTAHVELWGLLVLPGDSNLQPSAESCSQSCREYEPARDVLNGSQCNIWVWHPVNQQCWLKHEAPWNLGAALHRLSVAGSPSVPWTSGVWLESKPCNDCITPTSFSGCISKDMCNTSRECGSPAIDGYSHVDPRCFELSQTATLYHQLLENATVLEAAHELSADYDGLGVHWGIGHKKDRWEDCEQACREHKPGFGGGPFASLPCNVWTWCSRAICFEPDAHSHHLGDCWLKFSELPHAPEVNMREPMRSAFMRRHRTQMAGGVPWVSGALLPPGVKLTNGTWGPRAFW